MEKRRINVASGGGNCSEGFRRECEARYWLDILCGRLAGADFAAERFGRKAHIVDLEEMFKSIQERIIQKRGKEAAGVLFREMSLQWVKSGRSKAIEKNFGQLEAGTITRLLALGAGNESSKLE